MYLLIFLALFVGCTPTPKKGVAKGCVDQVRFDHPIVEGLGISSHIEWGDDEQAAAYRAHEQAAWMELGPRWIRRDMDWATLEPQAGVWNLAPVDRVLEATDSVGARLLALLDYGNPAYPPHAESTTQPVDNPDHFAQYAARIAEEYGDRITHYEIWNEQNAGYSFWQPREDPVAYAALLEATVPAIRAVAPDVVVAFGGLFWPDLGFNTSGPEFLEQVAELSPGLAGVDAVPIHPYRYPFTDPEAEEDHQGTLVDEICAARDQLDDLGLGSAELWVGELGWHTASESFAPGLDPDEQASVLVRAALLSFAQGATQFTWYTFRDSGIDPEDQEQMFGLVGYDPDPTDGTAAARKPAYHAYATLSEMLGTHDTIRDLSLELDLDAHTYGFELSGGPSRTVVLWTDGPPREVRVPMKGLDVVQTTALGAVSHRSVAGGVSIEFGPAPVYLTESG